ncbi:MAG TPA: HAMP domain-containing sensor histidine kinase, partial [candidate division Zixibacteria bacterium]|nr:HAMP domain-containing sensor histidine kinase [candidate division Zixibacteria bacterium]
MKRFTSELMREAKLSTDKEIIDVGAQLNEIAGFLRPQRRFKRVKLGLELPREPVRFETDPMLFQQLIYNLANNAADACAKSANPCVRILVCSSDDDSSFTLSVSDNGAGMDQETLTQAFNTRFTTKKDGNGFGLLV